MKDSPVLSPSAVVSPPGFCGELRGHEFLMTGLRTGNTEIYRVDPFTGDALNLTRASNSHQRYPSWSHGGSRIAFTSDRDGTYNVYAMKDDGSEVRQVTFLTAPNLAYFPTWHAASRRLLYGVAGKEALVCSVASDGSDVRIIGPGRDPHPAPDEKRIAFTSWQETGYAVFTMGIDGADVRQLTEANNTIGAVTPTYSPDGSRIAYSDRVGDCLELFSVDAGSGVIAQLTQLGLFATSPAWSPDGRHLSFRLTDDDFWNHPERMRVAYHDKLADKRPVWVMDADGSNPHVVEAMHYQCGIDGSRAVWNPMGKCQ